MCGTRQRHWWQEYPWNAPFAMSKDTKTICIKTAIMDHSWEMHSGMLRWIEKQKHWDSQHRHHWCLCSFLCQLNLFTITNPSSIQRLVARLKNFSWPPAAEVYPTERRLDRCNIWVSQLEGLWSGNEQTDNTQEDQCSKIYLQLAQYWKTEAAIWRELGQLGGQTTKVRWIVPNELWRVWGTATISPMPGTPWCEGYTTRLPWHKKVVTSKKDMPGNEHYPQEMASTLDEDRNPSGDMGTSRYKI